MSPAAPLPPGTPVTGEVVNSREVWNRRSGALPGRFPIQWIAYTRVFMNSRPLWARQWPDTLH